MVELKSMHDDEQDSELKRVEERIAEAIVEFCRNNDRFRAETLRRFVRGRVGIVAPGSPDRVLRDLRQRGFLDYRVVSRSESMYEVIRMIRKTQQGNLF